MIELQGYTIVKEIGRGAFATVYLGHPATAPTHRVAIKAVRTAGLTKKLAEALAAEVAILRSMTHPNIVRLEAIETDKRRQLLFLVMEFMEGGDVGALMRGVGGGDGVTMRGLPEEQVRAYVRQLVAALSCLRKANLVHRDIKPQNLLLSKDKEVLKLADFGFARYVEEDDLAETLCGSPLYMAPEILRYEKYDERADLWSVGAVMFEMLTGRPPFRAQNHIQLLKVIERSNGKIDMPAGVGESAQSLIFGLLKQNPNERIDFDQLVNHPFLQCTSSISDHSSSLFEVRPIPITQRRSSLSSSLSSSPKIQSSLVSNAVMSRRRSTPSIPSSLATAASTQQTQSQMAASSREQWSWEDEQMILSLPEDCHGIARRGQVLFELLQRCTLKQQELVCRLSFTAFLAAHDQLVAADKQHEGVSWLMSRLRDLAADLDFEADASEDDQTTDDVPVPCLLYDMAMRMAVEGGFQELLGRLSSARLHYHRSLFIMEEFGLKGSALVDEYKAEVQCRLRCVEKKMIVY